MSAAEKLVPSNTEACRHCSALVENTHAAWREHFDTCDGLKAAMRAEWLAVDGPQYVPEHEKPRHHQKAAFMENQVTHLLDKYGML